MSLSLRSTLSFLVTQSFHFLLILFNLFSNMNYPKLFFLNFFLFGALFLCYLLFLLLFSQSVVEARSLRSRCPQGRFLLRAQLTVISSNLWRSLACRCITLISASIFIWCSSCVFLDIFFINFPFPMSDFIMPFESCIL